ncbi:MAG: hydantoinase/oxoprolinase family protein [Burkholderiales bacterium]
MSIMVAADTGGTFTDLAAFDSATGKFSMTKSLTTYDDLVNGLMDCFHKAKIELPQAEIVKFATTLVINTFVQRNGAKTALLATEGHRDILEIKRGNRAVPFDLRYERDAVLIERDLRIEVRERIGGDGSVVRPLDAAQIESIASDLQRQGIEAIAISFLNAYANSTHEDQAAALLRSRLPGVYVVAGSELTREWYEYERTATAAANAYAGPKLADCITRLDSRMRAEGFSKTFYMMASNGGVVALQRARQQPCAMLESGPVGGCIGAGAYADALGLAKIIAFDMGGTTAKCGIVQNGQFEVKSPYFVGGEEKGFPVRHAVIDIVEVGAGGGSIAHLDDQGRVAVGPRSAGSTPGPVCYGLGGKEPTITDANLALGRISAASFLGGEMRLDEASAITCINDLAESLGFTGAAGHDEMAQGIIALGTLTMASAIRQITTERGLDPRDFALFAFGGGGPLHAQALAREMNIPEVVIPPEPGIFSAIGMLLADARVDETRTFLRPLSQEAATAMAEAFTQMEATMRAALAAELGPVPLTLLRQAQLRFAGQRHFVQTGIAPDSSLAQIRSSFEALYRQRYGHVDEGAPIEIVGLTLTATAQIQRPPLAQLRPVLTDKPATPRKRAVYFAERAARIDTPVYDRNTLPSGFESAGPAVIEEYGSTTIVGPDDFFTIGALGEIRIRLRLD